MKLALFPLVTLLVFTSGVTLAADSSARAAAADACRADVDKFCPGVEPGGGRVAACIKQNRRKLSQECKDALAKADVKKKSSAPAAAPKG